MDTKKETPKSKVARPKRRRIGSVIVVIGVILVFISILLQTERSSQEKPKKAIVTASQADTRVRIETKPEPSTVQSEQNQKESSENNSAQTTSSAELNVNLLADLQEKINQQQIRLRQAAAQKKLIAPSSVYQINQETDIAKKNPLMQLLDANSQFANAAANQSVMTLSAAQQESTDLKIFQGKIIPAVLDTAINSDLPGMIRATITEEIYGETGKQILLPRGTRLIGQYNSAVITGQVRIYVIWTRAITPQQIDIRLASPGVDALGRSGLAGSVDNHFWDIFGTSLLLSVMAAGVSDMETDTSDSLYGNPYQDGVVASANENSDELLSRRLDIKPTIQIDQGTVVRVMVAHDLNFSDLPIMLSAGS
ncbi:MAG: TrbI/VirB10 family protein [Gammaproteobacteria bacterium]